MSVILVSLAIVVGLANLVLLLELVRRTQLLQRAIGTTEQPSGLPATGHTIAPFELEAVSGELVTAESLAAKGTSLVGFFTAGCEQCAKVRAELLAVRPELPITALVYGSDEAGHAVGSALEGIAEVAYFDDGVITRAFGASNFPTLLLVESGRVAAAGRTLGDVFGR